MLALLDDPIMTGFVEQLDEINALADAAPGFVWRLQTKEGDATALRVFDNDMLIVNMSVWESVDALFRYTYYSDHARVFRDRRNWFEFMDEHHLVLWWVPSGHEPEAAEAKDRLTTLRAIGPSAEAFTIKKRFDPPNS